MASAARYPVDLAPLDVDVARFAELPGAPAWSKWLCVKMTVSTSSALTPAPQLGRFPPCASGVARDAPPPRRRGIASRIWRASRSP